MTIGDRLKQLRKELNLTQEAFASRIGSVQNTITGYENGRRNPSAPVVSLICREFDVNEDWLRNGTGGTDNMFISKSVDELDALSKKYNLSNADQVLIEKYVNLKPSSREMIINFLTDVISELNSVEDMNSKESSTKNNYTDIPNTPEELEQNYITVDAEEKKGGLG